MRAASVVEARGITCDFGEPFNVTTVTLDNGIDVKRWGCKLDPAAEVEHAHHEDDFKIGTYDSRDMSVPDTSLTKRQYNACGISCTTYCVAPA